MSKEHMKSRLLESRLTSSRLTKIIHISPLDVTVFQRYLTSSAEFDVKQMLTMLPD